MGYTKRFQKRAQAEKVTREIMSSAAYREARKKDMEQAALHAYWSFCIVTCDFLELRHRYKKRGLMKFLKFASQRLKYVEENENYFFEMNEMYKDEMDLDVLGLLGMRFEGGEVNG
jgi:hypothetical protein